MKFPPLKPLPPKPKYELYEGDCLELMDEIPNNSVDMVLCDLPYGTTQNKWDSVICLESLWEAYYRICKRNAAIVLTAQSPFDKILGASNIAHLKCEWIWEKEAGTGFLNAKKYPLKSHENVLVFCQGVSFYNPQMEKGKAYSQKQGHVGSNYGKVKEHYTINQGDRYPKSIIRVTRDEEKTHPTQKPVSLMSYLIKTYTNPGQTVLDNTMGSGTTGHSCALTGRRFIGIEKDPHYFAMAEERIGEAYYLFGNRKQTV